MMKEVPKYVLFSAFIASIGSFLFGYNSAIIAGAILYIEDEFHLSLLHQSFLVANLVLGAIFGSFLGGFLADKIGRKKALIVTSLIFILGGVETISSNFHFVLFGRFLQGIGVGVVSLVVPLYIAEISPSKYRGALVSFNQFAIVLGVVVAYIASFLFLDWRWMVGVSFLFSFFMLTGLLFISETPSYLFYKKKKKKAKKALEKLKISFQENNFLSENKEKKNFNFKSLFKKEFRKPLVVGVGISVIQQITGINAIIYFAPKIFKLAKSFNHQEAIFITVFIGVIQLLFTVVSIFLIDKVGRKKLLLVGILGMAFSTGFLGFSFYFQSFFQVKLFLILCYCSFFAVSLGPIAWLLISEIFPLDIRGKAMGFAAFSNWTSNYLISLSFLPILNGIGASNTFFLFSSISFLSFYFVKRKIPETKNKSLKEIQEFWKKM